MNEPTSRMISVRAIEDIIQIQKMIEVAPNINSVQTEKDRSEEGVAYCFKHDAYSAKQGGNCLSSIIKECDMENSFKCNDKNCKILEMSGWAGDCGLTKFINPEVVVLENIGILEGTASEADVKCWSSDSDVTVLRVKKEFRSELSNRVEWEEQRNLADDASTSSANLDWESHSLINLASIVGKEKDIPEVLTPFTIWSKTSDVKNSSMVLLDNMRPFAAFESYTPEIRFSMGNDNANVYNDFKKSGLRKKKMFRNIFRSVFCCVAKKKSF